MTGKSLTTRLNRLETERTPAKRSAYILIYRHDETLDQAAQRQGIDLADVRACLPDSQRTAP